MAMTLLLPMGRRAGPGPRRLAVVGGGVLLLVLLLASSASALSAIIRGRSSGGAFAFARPSYSVISPAPSSAGKRRRRPAAARAFVASDLAAAAAAAAADYPPEEILGGAKDKESLLPLPAMTMAMIRSPKKNFAALLSGVSRRFGSPRRPFLRAVAILSLVLVGFFGGGGRVMVSPARAAALWGSKPDAVAIVDPPPRKPSAGRVLTKLAVTAGAVAAGVATANRIRAFDEDNDSDGGPGGDDGEKKAGFIDIKDRVVPKDEPSPLPLSSEWIEQQLEDGGVAAEKDDGKEPTRATTRPSASNDRRNDESKKKGNSPSPLSSEWIDQQLKDAKINEGSRPASKPAADGQGGSPAATAKGGSTPSPPSPLSSEWIEQELKMGAKAKAESPFSNPPPGGDDNKNPSLVKDLDSKIEMLRAREELAKADAEKKRVEDMERAAEARKLEQNEVDAKIAAFERQQRIMEQERMDRIRKEKAREKAEREERSREEQLAKLEKGKIEQSRLERAAKTRQEQQSRLEQEKMQQEGEGEEEEEKDDAPKQEVIKNLNMVGNNNVAEGANGDGGSVTKDSEAGDGNEEARRQPKSVEEEGMLKEKYGGMDLEERAFNILVDLGMVDVHSDPGESSGLDLDEDDDSNVFM